MKKALKGSINLEKYGTIPPRFTKAWWEHYLYYYKFHIIVAAFLIFMFGSIIYSNVTRIHYDMQVSYLGLFGINPDHEAALSAYFEAEIDDVTENGKKEIGYIYYSFDNVMEDDVVSEEEYAYQMKLVAELQGGDSDLYFMTGTNADELAGFGENFMNVYEFAGEDCPADRIKSDMNGHPFAVSVSGNEKLGEMGIDTSELYICVRQLYEGNKKDEIKVKTHENSLKAAKLLIGE